MYRALNRHSAALYKSWIDESFPTYRSKVIPFGSDWLGRVWATTLGQSESDSMVYLFDPADDSHSVPSTFESVNDGEFSEHGERALLHSLFAEWLGGDPSDLGYTDCAGYKVSPILGGTVSADNLERTDMSVNWHLMSQIREQAQELSPGTTISGVSISDQ
ncbi:MAG TPA: DUF1851 domain-containing protein [Candidatus Dietzia merdigallinarum]|nr:DUF1851 domain-containing protein [Candidatus Dietzia merdigallinarum]